ncbi:uncharacterized protein BX663DRAFT_514166 [Cokeromyces recurvatus]|uniref:uncharacterized protein n=1 Tax=Cokeromyces recurvatus TaxID=90255 RepID=UPI00221FA3DC|nr:uncharacterized protein BX663DRAFT_514166 [Cokeromyces recurvatus]KAI7901342.1 hypothetical protein BX663DRAFT_514166 [Cokeromyces recurvatus]
MMITTCIYFIIYFVCSFAVQGLPIHFRPILSSSKVVITRDTAQAHYESIIDNVLSQHNEGLLTELSIVIKDPFDTIHALRPQAEHLIRSPIEGKLQCCIFLCMCNHSFFFFFFFFVCAYVTLLDTCVAQMPGMIANQIHELNNVLYSSIDQITNKFWTKTDLEYRQFIINSIHKSNGEETQVIDELIDSLEMANTDIADGLIAIVDRFDLLSRIKKSLQQCQSVFNLEQDGQQIKSSFTDKVLLVLLEAYKQTLTDDMNSNSEEVQEEGFLNIYLDELISSLQSELYNRVYELARGIYEDLAFNN